MADVFICDAIRTPIGRYGGGLAGVRADDLGAIPIRALLDRNPHLDAAAIEEVFLGCANQAGEDNRNVARMSLLLAGLPATVPGVTLNRLCASGLEAVGQAARAIRCGEMDLAVAGGVENMTRAPVVMGKAGTAFGRDQKIEDTTMGWRFVNPRLDANRSLDLFRHRSLVGVESGWIDLQVGRANDRVRWQRRLRAQQHGHRVEHRAGSRHRFGRGAELLEVRRAPMVLVGRRIHVHLEDADLRGVAIFCNHVQREYAGLVPQRGLGMPDCRALECVELGRIDLKVRQAHEWHGLRLGRRGGMEEQTEHQRAQRKECVELHCHA